MDSLILCKFLRGALDDLMAEAAEMLRLVTGWDVTADELCQTARRIVTAKKLFNIRAGWKPEEDTLPARSLPRACRTIHGPGCRPIGSAPWWPPTTTSAAGPPRAGLITACWINLT